jgi:hypothetical protein
MTVKFLTQKFMMQPSVVVAGMDAKINELRSWVLRPSNWITLYANRTLRIELRIKTPTVWAEEQFLVNHFPSQATQYIVEQPLKCWTQSLTYNAG